MKSQPPAITSDTMLEREGWLRRDGHGVEIIQKATPEAISLLNGKPMV